MRDRGQRTAMYNAAAGQPVRTSDVPYATGPSRHSRPAPARRCSCGRLFQHGDGGSRCGLCRGGMGWLGVLEFVGPAGKAAA